MTYPTYGNGSLKLGTCPTCGAQKEPQYKYCNYDCYVEAPEIEKQNKTLEKGMMMYPIITTGRDFKHIKPSDKSKVWDEQTKQWVKP